MPRIARHNRLVEEVTKAARRIGYQTHVEVSIPTPGGEFESKRPDLILSGEGLNTWVIDPTIVADNCGDLNDPHRAKVRKYGDDRIVRETVARLTGSEPRFTSVTINWRGAFSPECASDLAEIGFTKRDLSLFSAIVVEQSAVLYRIWSQSNWRLSRRDRGLRR